MALSADDFRTNGLNPTTELICRPIVPALLAAPASRTWRNQEHSTRPGPTTPAPCSFSGYVARIDGSGFSR